MQHNTCLNKEERSGLNLRRSEPGDHSTPEVCMSASVNDCPAAMLESTIA